MVFKAVMLGVEQFLLCVIGFSYGIVVIDVVIKLIAIGLCATKASYSRNEHAFFACLLGALC